MPTGIVLPCIPGPMAFMVPIDASSVVIAPRPRIIYVSVPVPVVCAPVFFGVACDKVVPIALYHPRDTSRIRCVQVMGPAL